MCRATTRLRLRAFFNYLFTVKSFFAVLFSRLNCFRSEFPPQQPPNFNYNTVKSRRRPAGRTVTVYRAAEHVQRLCKSASDVIDFSRAMGAIVAPIISPSARYLGTGPPWPPTNGPRSRRGGKFSGTRRRSGKMDLSERDVSDVGCSKGDKYYAPTTDPGRPRRVAHGRLKIYLDEDCRWKFDQTYRLKINQIEYYPDKR